MQLDTWMRALCAHLALLAVCSAQSANDLPQRCGDDDDDAAAAAAEAAAVALRDAPRRAFALAASRPWRLAPVPSERDAEDDAEDDAEEQAKEQAEEQAEPPPACEAGEAALGAVAIAYPDLAGAVLEIATANAMLTAARAAIAASEEVTLADIVGVVTAADASFSNDAARARTEIEAIVARQTGRSVTRFTARQLATAAATAAAGLWAERIEPWARERGGAALAADAIGFAVVGDDSDGGLALHNRSGRDLTDVLLRIGSDLADYPGVGSMPPAYAFVPRWPAGAVLVLDPELVGRALARAGLDDPAPGVALGLWSPEGCLETLHAELSLHAWHCALAARVNSLDVPLVTVAAPTRATRARLRAAWRSGGRQGALDALGELRRSHPLEPVFVLLLAEALGSVGCTDTQKGATSRTFRELFRSLAAFQVGDAVTAAALQRSLEVLGTPLWSQDAADASDPLAVTRAHAARFEEPHPQFLLSCPELKALRSWVERNRREIQRRQRNHAAALKRAERIHDQLRSMRLESRRVPITPDNPLGVVWMFPTDVAADISLLRQRLHTIEASAREALVKIGELETEIGVYEARLAELQG